MKLNLSPQETLALYDALRHVLSRDIKGEQVDPLRQIHNRLRVSIIDALSPNVNEQFTAWQAREMQRIADLEKQVADEHAVDNCC